MDLSNLDSTTRIIGLCASGLLFISFSLYTILYVMLIGKYKLPKWQSISFLADEIGKPWFKLFTVCQAITFISGLCYLILVCVFYSLTKPALQLEALISIVFAVMFIILSSEHYYVQLTYVLTRLKEKRLDSLEEYSQLYSKSMIISKNILGWTLFFALSSFFLIPLFDASTLGLWLKVVFAINGVFCVLGFIGYTFNKMILNILYFNGMGFAVIVFSLLSFLYFL